MKRCLEICSIASEFPGSFVKNMQALIERAENSGIILEFVFPIEAEKRQWCKEISKKVKVYFVNASKAVISPSTYKQLRNILCKGNYDIVHCHYESYDIPTKIIKCVCRLPFRLIFHLHCNPLAFPEIYSPLKRIYYKLKYKFFTRNVELVAINDRDKKIIEGYSKKSQIRTILNGVSLSELSNKFIADKNNFMMLGWEFFTKGDDIVLDACKLLAQRGHNFKMFINGNDDTLQKINEYLNGPFPDYLEFQKPQYDRNDFFSLADVLIVASRTETFNYGIAEASYLGKHIITSDIHGVSWSFCLPNVHTFKSESSEELANLMEEYLLKGNEWQFDKQAVSNHIADRYSDSAWSKALIELYNE